MNKVKIGNSIIGKREPTFIIAEAGSNHDGKIEQVKRLIDIAVDSGVDAVKFQAFKADKLFNTEEIVNKLKKLEFKDEWYEEIFDYTKDKNIILLFSVFDEETVDKLDNYGMDAYKVASYEFLHFPLLEKIIKTNKPIILSTGMSNLSEVKDVIDLMNSNGNDQIILMHCVSQYPAQIEDVNLKSILTLKKFNFPVGFSDHTLGIYAPIAAVSIGSNVIEKHFTISRDLDGPDHSYSLEPPELKEMVNGIRTVEKMLGSEDILPSDYELGQRKSRRAIYAKNDIKSGKTIKKDDLIILRPSPQGCMIPNEINNIIGKRARKYIKKGDLLKEDLIV
jgi:N-acetylneuraminate synthase/N,N'-diacetyllegionaminate synthase